MVEILLLIFIKLLLVILVILWITIGVSIIYRRRRTRNLQLIEATFAEVISKFLYPFPGENMDHIQIQRRFRSVGIINSKPKNVQYLIDLMIRTQRSMLGTNYEKLVVLFNQIPPYGASASKLNSKNWYHKARGIREIYEMDQGRYVKQIIKERNNANIYVRREAQIALVIFLGWESLRFLSYLKKKMTLWQQIKIVEKLHDLHPIPNLDYLRRAYDSDKTYANGLLMRVIRKFNLITEIDHILNHIDSYNFETRESAIYCISSFYLSEEQLISIKEKFFKIPNTAQQIQLMKYLDKISFEKDLIFYKKLLNSSDKLISLSSAEILWNNGFKEIVQEFYYQQYSDKSVHIQTSL